MDGFLCSHQLWLRPDKPGGSRRLPEGPSAEDRVPSVCRVSLYYESFGCFVKAGSGDPGPTLGDPRRTLGDTGPTRFVVGLVEGSGIRNGDTATATFRFRVAVATLRSS